MAKDSDLTSLLTIARTLYRERHVIRNNSLMLSSTDYPVLFLFIDNLVEQLYFSKPITFGDAGKTGLLLCKAMFLLRYFEGKPRNFERERRDLVRTVSSRNGSEESIQPSACILERLKAEKAELVLADLSPQDAFAVARAWLLNPNFLFIGFESECDLDRLKNRKRQIEFLFEKCLAAGYKKMMSAFVLSVLKESPEHYLGDAVKGSMESFEHIAYASLELFWVKLSRALATRGEGRVCDFNSLAKVFHSYLKDRETVDAASLVALRGLLRIYQNDVVELVTVGRSGESIKLRLGVTLAGLCFRFYTQPQQLESYFIKRLMVQWLVMAQTKESQYRALSEIIWATRNAPDVHSKSTKQVVDVKKENLLIEVIEICRKSGVDLAEMIKKGVQTVESSLVQVSSKSPLEGVILQALFTVLQTPESSDFIVLILAQLSKIAPKSPSASVQVVDSSQGSCRPRGAAGLDEALRIRPRTPTPAGDEFFFGSFVAFSAPSSASRCSCRGCAAESEFSASRS
ncbi:MAG: hypothetical protein EBX40_01610 [Gammaproteobacteria bacterium]|nr:hypothetical protein [Gammaproteobacteria bacterium]